MFAGTSCEIFIIYFSSNRQRAGGIHARHDMTWIYQHADEIIMSVEWGSFLALRLVYAVLQLSKMKMTRSSAYRDSRWWMEGVRSGASSALRSAGRNSALSTKAQWIWTSPLHVSFGWSSTAAGPQNVFKTQPAEQRSVRPAFPIRWVHSPPVINRETWFLLLLRSSGFLWWDKIGVKLVQESG
jgi:hypothetical protein